MLNTLPEGDVVASLWTKLPPDAKSTAANQKAGALRIEPKTGVMAGRGQMCPSGTTRTPTLDEDPGAGWQPSLTLKVYQEQIDGQNIVKEAPIIAKTAIIVVVEQKGDEHVISPASIKLEREQSRSEGYEAKVIGESLSSMREIPPVDEE